jgi:hypothetical protein
MLSLSAHHQKILELLPRLPDTAKVPIQVAAVHEGVSDRTIRRNYPLVEMGARLKGVSLGYLRRRISTATAA